MIQTNQIAAVVVFVAALLGSTRAATADTIVITRGSIDVVVSYNPLDQDIPDFAGATISLSGHGFQFDGTFTGDVEFENLKVCLHTSCRAGDLMSPEASLFGAQIFGDLTFDHATYHDVFFDGDFSILPGRVILPKGKFKLDPRSSLTGFTFRDTEIVGVFPTHNFAGEGTFTFLGSRIDSFGQPRATARYAFQPTPEPATMLLLGAGVSVVVARRRRIRTEALPGPKKVGR